MFSSPHLQTFTAWVPLAAYAHPICLSDWMGVVMVVAGCVPDVATRRLKTAVLKPVSTPSLPELCWTTVFSSFPTTAIPN